MDTTSMEQLNSDEKVFQVTKRDVRVYRRYSDSYNFSRASATDTSIKMCSLTTFLLVRDRKVWVILRECQPE